MRCLALADELRSRGARTRFLCRSLPGSLPADIRSRNHELAILPGGSGTDLDPEADAAATIAVLSDAPPWNWLVADHYGLDERWETPVRTMARKIFAIDDLADRRHDADLLLDQGLHPQGADRYARLVPPGCRMLLGPTFALLRSEFVAPGHREASTGGFNVNVSFGGTDPQGMTLRALRALEVWGAAGIGIDVALGSGSPQLPAVAEACQRIPGTRLHVDATCMAALFGRASLGIGAGGGSNWERCRMGLPAVVFSVAPNQRSNCRALAAARAAVNLGDPGEVTTESLAALLRSLASHPRLLDRMGRRAAALVDGRGVERVALLLLRGPVSFRRATLKDAHSSWRWRDHPSTRRFSVDPAPVPWSTHERWWSNSIASEERILLVAASRGSDLGILRYDLEGSTATVSIYLDPGLAGLGLGTVILREGTAWLAANAPSVDRIHAVILPENLASVRSFRAAGYDPTGTERDWSLSMRKATRAGSPGET
jgi:UDP-2,4-diacetamido-2,4,6-trideoxy-beta-L-altropyranose hydrolase